jgi:hypothetical protein
VRAEYHHALLHVGGVDLYTTLLDTQNGHPYERAQHMSVVLISVAKCPKNGVTTKK